MKTHASQIVIALLLFARIGAAQGNLIYNGGFDITFGNDAPGWTQTGSSFANVKNGNPAPDLVLGLGQAASQTVNNLTAGALYVVAGDYRCYATDHTNLSFRVAVDGVSLFETAGPIDPTWNHFSVQFSPSSPSAVLSLTQTYAAYPSVDAYSIDNIGMYIVPEPSVSGLFFLGACSLWWRWKPKPHGANSRHGGQWRFESRVVAAVAQAGRPWTLRR